MTYPQPLQSVSHKNYFLRDQRRKEEPHVCNREDNEERETTVEKPSKSRQNGEEKEREQKREAIIKNAHVALVSLRLAMDQRTQKANPSAVRLILAAPADSPVLFSKAVKQDSNKDDG